MEKQNKYRNGPKFSKRQALANSADPEQTAPRGAVCSGSLGAVCSGSALFAIPFAFFYEIPLYLMVWPLCLNFRLITARFSGVRKFRNFTVSSRYTMVK